MTNRGPRYICPSCSGRKDFYAKCCWSCRFPQGDNPDEFVTTVNGETVTRGRLYRLTAKIAVREQCWEWTGGKDRDGYGLAKFTPSGKTWPAHRLVYQITYGELPRELTLDHLCRNRCCVNPRHLDPVSHAENVRRGWQSRR